MHGQSDAAKRFEAYPAEDVELDLTGKVIPDDERVRRVKRYTKIWVTQGKELLGRAFRIGGASKIAL